jgi:hypothetical protein
LRLKSLRNEKAGNYIDRNGKKMDNHHRSIPVCSPQVFDSPYRAVEILSYGLERSCLDSRMGQIFWCTPCPDWIWVPLTISVSPYLCLIIGINELFLWLSIGIISFIILNHIYFSFVLSTSPAESSVIVRSVYSLQSVSLLLYIQRVCYYQKLFINIANAFFFIS